MRTHDDGWTCAMGAPRPSFIDHVCGMSCYSMGSKRLRLSHLMCELSSLLQGSVRTRTRSLLTISKERKEELLFFL